MSAIRTFIAVPMPPQVIQKVHEIQETLKQAGSNTAWTRPTNIHLTLKFLGNIEEEQVPTITGVLEQIARDFKPFILPVTNMGAFPNVETPKILWLGLDPRRTPLLDLADRVERDMVEVGMRPEKRKFRAHITFGRVRTPKNITPLLKLLGPMEQITLGDELEPVQVESLFFFKSTLDPTGAIYEPLAMINLGPQ